MSEITEMIENNPEEALGNYKKPAGKPAEEKPAEENVEDKPTEVKEEKPKEEKPEEKKPDGEGAVEEKPSEEKPKAEEPKALDAPDTLSVVSNLLGQEFNTADEVSEYIRSLKEKETVLEELQRKYQELESGVDPLQFFVNETEYKRQIALKQFPDYDPTLITKVMQEGSDKLKDLDAVRLHRRLTDPDVYESDADVDVLLRKELGVDADEEIDVTELDRTQLLQLKKFGKEARRDFAKVHSELKMPEKVDVKGQKEEALRALTEKQDTQRKLWKPALKDLTKELDKIEFKYTDPETKEEVVLYTHEIDKDFVREVEKVLPQMADLLVERGVEYNRTAEKEEKAKMVGALKNKYLAENVNKIMFAYGKQVEKNHADKQHKESHNPREPNLQERPTEEKSVTQSSKEKLEADILRSYGVES